MFCKNLIIYDIHADNILSSINNELLQKIAFTPCSPTDFVKSGFVSPIDDPDVMIVEVGDHALLQYQTEQKILPNDVIKRTLFEKIAKRESMLGFRLPKSEKAALKDEVLIDLLPQAFSKFSWLNVWINKRDKTIAVTTSSFAKAENVLAHLRKELGMLAVTPLTCDFMPESILTDWLRDNKPTCFDINDCAVLIDVIETSSKVKLINEQLNSQEVKSYLDSGRMVESLALTFNQGVKFTINKSLTLSKITFDNSILDQNEDIPSDEHEKLIEANFFLAAETLSKLIQEVKHGLKQGS